MEFTLDIKEHGSGMPMVQEESVLSLSYVGSKPQIDMLHDAIDRAIRKIGHAATKEEED